MLTEFKDLQGQREEARAGGVGVVLTGSRADFIGRWQEEQERHFVPELQHLLAVDPEVLRLDTHMQEV